MSEYTLVKKSSLEEVAEAIRQKGGTTADLVFPDGFIAAINALQSETAETPTTETLTLGFFYGYSFSSSVKDYIAVGHNSDHTNNDAVWSFTPTINASSATFHFTWDNYPDGSNHGWAGAMDYAFAVTTDSSLGMTAQNATNKKVISIGGSGTSGEVDVVIDDLSLIAGTTYYIRANYNGSTLSTLKAFAKSGNTVQLTT